MTAYLQSLVKIDADRRLWSQLPADFERDAIRFCKSRIGPHFRGKGNHLIRARVKLAKAQTWTDLLDAVSLIEEKK